MATVSEYAQLSARAYVLDRSPANRPFIPLGWEALDETRVSPSGFQAGVYTNGREIVIAFCGTSGFEVFNDSNARADWANNLQLALGGLGEQMREAVRVAALPECDTPRRRDQGEART